MYPDAFMRRETADAAGLLTMGDDTDTSLKRGSTRVPAGGRVNARTGRRGWLYFVAALRRP